ncbi:hypothetical protein NHQ30_004344 [Ciborinia camelliae]|nr:hypothetical protein NHQ30_004344 [Ciborinia camelliae]
MRTSNVPNIDCHAICSNARRADNTYAVVGDVVLEGTPCNAGGRFQCANLFEMEGRAKCVQPSNSPQAPGGGR